ATAELSYNIPGANKTIKETQEIRQNFVALEKSDSCLRFASSVIMLGMALKQSQFLKQFSWDQLYSAASTSANRSSRLEMEFIDLIVEAKK
ncbi:MAG TPA: YfbK domain-containing protein, partial [Segetibacter sp.]